MLWPEGGGKSKAGGSKGIDAVRKVAGDGRRVRENGDAFPFQWAAKLRLGFVIR